VGNPHFVGTAKPVLKPLLARRKQLREKHGLTQEASAESAGMSYKYYPLVESGRKQDLRISTLERLASAYGIEVYQLLGPTMPKTRLAKPPVSKTSRA
jgi:transcriptional regulator with XRE-family HTH domain